MNNQAFDELIRKKLNVPKKAPSDMWERIEQKLDEQDAAKTASKTIPFLYRGIAAAALLAVAITTFFLWDNEEPSDQSPTFTNIQNSADAPTSQNNVAQQPLETAPQKFDRKYNHTAFINLESKNNYAEKKDIKYSSQEQMDSNQAYVISPIIPIQNQIGNNHLPISTPETPIIKDNIAQNPTWKHDYLKPFPNEQRITPETSQSMMTMGISGGYNIGSVSNGAAFAFNTRKQINDKIFVDGTLGLVMNNADANLASYNGNFFADQKMMKASNTKARPTTNQFGSANALYYIQINPSFGYNLTKKIDISAGPDYQQMISNTDADVIHFNAERLTKKLPKHDFGITGKAEFSLSPNLKAGVSYREGVSALISNNNDIQNRRYMQVHLKIQLSVRD